jgi:hypothetical protein
VDLRTGKNLFFFFSFLFFFFFSFKEFFFETRLLFPAYAGKGSEDSTGPALKPVRILRSGLLPSRVLG